MTRVIFVFIVFSIVIYVDAFRILNSRRVMDNGTALQPKPFPKDKTKLQHTNITRKSMTYNKSARKMAYRTVNSDNIQQRSFNTDNPSNRNFDTNTGSQSPVYRNSDSRNAGNTSLENVVMSLNSGLKKILQQNNIQPNFLDSYAQQVIDFFSMNAGPMFRAAEAKYAIKPEIVHFRSEKPTVKFEINANSIVALMKDVLKSEAFNKNLDNIVQQAGILFRTLQQGGVR